MFKSDDTGKLVLRLVLGILILLHGLFKLQNGIGPIAGMITAHGLPGFVAYLVYVGEVVAPLMVILGLAGRLGALIIVVNMLVAFGLVHTGQLTSLNKAGGWDLELQGMYLFGALALAFMGSGRFSLGGRWN